MHHPKMSHRVTLSRSEGSVVRGIEMLRYRHLRAFRLSSFQRVVMRIKADKSAMGAINRPLRMPRLCCSSA